MKDDTKKDERNYDISEDEIIAFDDGIDRIHFNPFSSNFKINNWEKEECCQKDLNNES
jgi:hypothetical protein